MEEKKKVQLYTKQKNADEITDMLTGEVLKSSDDPIKLSDAKARLNLHRREIDKQEKWIDSILSPLVLEALEKGADTFAEFWKIQRGVMRFNEKKFLETATMEEISEYQEAKEKIKALTDKPQYYQAGKPSLRYPKQ